MKGTTVWDGVCSACIPVPPSGVESNFRMVGHDGVVWSRPFKVQL